MAVELRCETCGTSYDSPVSECEACGGSVSWFCTTCNSFVGKNPCPKCGVTRKKPRKPTPPPAAPPPVYTPPPPPRRPRPAWRGRRNPIQSLILIVICMFDYSRFRELTESEKPYFFVLAAIVYLIIAWIAYHILVIIWMVLMWIWQGIIAVFSFIGSIFVAVWEGIWFVLSFIGSIFAGAWNALVHLVSIILSPFGIISHQPHYGGIPDSNQNFSLNNPNSAVYASGGGLYISDRMNDRIIRVFSGGVSTWGNRGRGNGQFSKPRGIAVNRNGEVYVVDSDNHRIQYFDRNGSFRGSWGSQGSRPEQFSHPWGIAINSKNEVYVADTNNDRVSVFNSSGILLRTHTAGDQIRRPRGIAINRAGYLAVANAGSHTVLLLSPQGKLISRFGGKGARMGEFNYPSDVAFLGDNEIFVADKDNNRLQVISIASGQARLFKPSSDISISFPSGIAATNGGELIITNSGTNSIYHLDPNGRLRHRYGR